MRMTSRLVVVLMGIGATSCSNPPPATPVAPPASTQPAAADAATVTSAELFGTGVIKGRVTFEGDRPSSRKIPMSGDAVCAAAPAYVEEGKMLSADGGVPHAFVYLKQGVNGKYPVPAEAKRLDQKGCTYIPHVFGIQIGQALTIHNGDPTAHNVHGLGTRNPDFNISQPTIGMQDTKVFSREEVMMKVKCDVHGWMSSYAGILPHPFYTVTDESGNYQIEKLPPGSYTVEVWHETFQRRQSKMTLKEGETLDLNFVYAKPARP